MPILPQEVDVFPEDLLDRDGEDTKTWWVFQTLPRREKELMRRLRKLEIPHYCPLIPRKTRSPAGRVRTSYVPLFAGYLFSLADDQQRQHALKTNCIAQTLEVAEFESLIQDLRQVRQLIEANVPLSPESRIQPGQRVRILHGSLAGIEGVVVQRRGIERLLVKVGFLQQGASVALDDYQVEAI